MGVTRKKLYLMAILPSAIQVTENRWYGAEQQQYRSRKHLPVLLLHTVEGRVSRGVAAAHRNPPHLWYSPARRELFQTMDLALPARALNAPAGLETNHRGPCFQVEIEGFARELRSWPTDFYRNLALDVVIPLERLSRELYGVGFVAGPTTMALNYEDEQDGRFIASTRSPLRLSRAAWYGAHGIVGHQHVPGNDHWDPGKFDVSKLLQHIDVESLPPRELRFNPARGPVFEGLDVAEWQLQLTQLGFELGPSGVDGSYGAVTEQATRLFEQQNGLPVDGVVGVAERSLIEELLQPETVPLEPAGEPPPSSSPAVPTATAAVNPTPIPTPESGQASVVDVREPIDVAAPATPTSVPVRTSPTPEPAGLRPTSEPARPTPTPARAPSTPEPVRPPTTSEPARATPTPSRPTPTPDPARGTLPSESVRATPTPGAPPRDVPQPADTGGREPATGTGTGQSASERAPAGRFARLVSWFQRIFGRGA